MISQKCSLFLTLWRNWLAYERCHVLNSILFFAYSVVRQIRLSEFLYGVTMVFSTSKNWVFTSSAGIYFNLYSNQSLRWHLSTVESRVFPTLKLPLKFVDDIKVLDEKHLVTITNDYFKDSFGIYNKADITARYPKASIWTIYFINI